MKNYFPLVYGNEKTKERIGSAIEHNTLPHAFLIIGESGSGKSVLAREVAAALNCERRHASASLPCGECNCCRRIREGNFPDLKILSKPKDRATVGVDAIKDFREDMFLSSTESEYKIYVIDDAECMTTEAQNALLKVLEEPPTNVIIMILAREGDKILTTIKSRAQHIAMSRFNDSELERHLLNLSSDARELKRESEERFKSVIMSADGRLGLAIRLSNKKSAAECAEERAEIITLIRAMTSRYSYRELHEAISALPQKRAELSLVLESVISALRDLIVIKQDKNPTLIFFSSEKEAAEVCPQASVKMLLSVYEEIRRAHELCSRNANVTNLTAMMAARIRLI